MADQHPGCGGALRPTGTSGRYKCERCGQAGPGESPNHKPEAGSAWRR